MQKESDDAESGGLTRKRIRSRQVYEEELTVEELQEDEPKVPKWFARHRQIHDRAQVLKKKQQQNYLRYGDEDEQKEAKKARKVAQERIKHQELLGNFELGHEPTKVRSLKKVKKSQVAGDGHPFHLVKCTMEWFNHMDEKGGKTDVKDSKISYMEVREKAP